MDPISLFSILIKVVSFSPVETKNFEEMNIYKKSKTEIIELYRTEMNKNTNFDYSKKAN